MNTLKHNILTKINNLSGELTKVSDAIELDRSEGFEDDSSVRQELLDKQDMLEQQIDDLRDSLKMIENEKADFGKEFILEINGSPRTIQIVHKSEADPSCGKISNESPLAQALSGKNKGEAIIVETPAGKQTYKII
ncbi:MAG: GreA/GreB family elongation factor [bacterium]